MVGLGLCRANPDNHELGLSIFDVPRGTWQSSLSNLQDFVGFINSAISLFKNNRRKCIKPLSFEQ